MLGAGPVYVIHDRRKFRLQTEEVTQLLSAWFEQCRLVSAGDLTKILILDHDAAGELNDGGPARDGDVHGHRWQERAVLRRELAPPRGS
jgi:hypothetical protein